MLYIILFFICLRVLLYFICDEPKREYQKEVQTEIQIQTEDEENKLLKGRVFEDVIADLVRQCIPDAVILQNAIFNVINKNGQDLYFQDKNETREYDLIVLSKKGLFVIECKNYANTFISGDLQKHQWKVSYSKKKVYEVLSPYKQVTSAVMNLKRYCPNNYFNRIVVFPDTTKVSKNLLDGEHIFNVQTLKWHLESIVKQHDVLNQNSINAIKEKLVEENTRARSMHEDAMQAHIDYVNAVKTAMATA